MKRIESCTKGMVLTCAALAFAFVGCTSSDSPQTGGLEATLTLDADASPDGVGVVGRGIHQLALLDHLGDQSLGRRDPVTCSVRLALLHDLQAGAKHDAPLLRFLIAAAAQLDELNLTPPPAGFRTNASAMHVFPFA